MLLLFFIAISFPSASKRLRESSSTIPKEGIVGEYHSVSLPDHADTAMDHHADTTKENCSKSIPIATF